MGRGLGSRSRLVSASISSGSWSRSNSPRRRNHGRPSICGISPVLDNSRTRSGQILPGDQGSSLGAVLLLDPGPLGSPSLVVHRFFRRHRLAHLRPACKGVHGRDAAVMARAQTAGNSARPGQRTFARDPLENRVNDSDSGALRRCIAVFAADNDVRDFPVPSDFFLNQ